ncbi:MAG TPA: aminotransferase class V-fold PLP-dependent enzyme [Pyrinomonadaceae bacterium]|nr:aminotransferase class V-fold PLP-dependent enzyme [Pyrinomonadaceae bacterium]
MFGNDSLRALFPVTQRANYLNHAAVSAPPLPTIRAIQSYLADVSQNGSANFRHWLATKEETRDMLAGLLGAESSQVAFVRNTSDALSTVANGLNWRAGDNLVTFRNEFPSNIYPWLRAAKAFNVEVRVCEERQGRIDLEELIALIDDRTRIVAVSHVQFASGFRIDLEQLGRTARAHNALLVADVIQSLGVMSVDVQKQLIDVAAGACHKWLLLPEGLGFLFLSERARERIEPTLVGWVSVPNPDDYLNWRQGWKEGTLSWETGTGPTALIYGLRESLRLLTTVGVAHIQQYLEVLTDHLCEILADETYEIVSPRAGSQKSQIVCIRHKYGLTPMSLYQHLSRRKIVTAPRGDRLRISPHFYNTLDEIEELVHALPR